jgi:hypothetical protein
MNQNDGSGVVGQRGFEHFPRINAGGVDGAPKKLLETDNPALFMSMLIEHREAPGCWHRLPAAVFAV